jgi:Tfp pilus assembly protein PilF
MTNLGQLMVRMERLQEAGMWFERAVRANPKSVTARVNMATAAAMVGRQDVARQQLAEALRIDPDNAFAKQKLADLEAGRLKPPATTQSTTMPTTAVGL